MKKHEKLLWCDHR